jgi:hypothetical protein
MSEEITEEQFADAVMEAIFIRGFICPPRDIVPFNVRSEWERLAVDPDPAAYGEWCIKFLDLTNRHENPAMGIPSTTGGARDEWMAVHEAGHALVGVKGGMKLWGVRFYNDGHPGETLFDDPGWGVSTDEDVLRREIRVGVAANLAEMIRGHQPAGGYPSRFFDDQKPVDGGQYPTDVIGAWKRALRLATVRFEREGKPLDPDEVWQASRVIVEQAEAEAEKVLRENLDALNKLAEELKGGPMTGAAVRAIVGR